MIEVGVTTFFSIFGLLTSNITKQKTNKHTAGHAHSGTNAVLWSKIGVL